MKFRLLFVLAVIYSINSQAGFAAKNETPKDASDAAFKNIDQSIDTIGGGLDNKPSRLEWLQDNGFGMFMHWGVDAQLGSVISHSLVGASDDFVKRYRQELPKTYNPKKWDP